MSLDSKTDHCNAFLENNEILWGIANVLDQRTLIDVLLLKVKHKKVLVILRQIVKVVDLRQTLKNKPVLRIVVKFHLPLHKRLKLGVLLAKFLELLNLNLS